MITDRSELIEDALVQLAQHGTPGSSPTALFDVGSSDFIQYFSKTILQDMVAMGGATCRFFEGSYGFGKTHLLRLIHDEASALGFAVTSTELTTDLRLESWDRITRYILQRIELPTESGPVHGLAHVLHTLARRDQVDLYTFLRTPLPHPGFKRAMEYTVRSDELSEDLIRFLDGEKVRVTALRSAGFPGVRDPLSARNAEFVLQTVTRGLIALGLPGVALLFDETDQSFNPTTIAARKKAQVGANLMRRMIDACTTGRVNGLVCVFAVLPSFIEQCGHIYPALGQRLDREIRVDRAEPWRSPVISVPSASSLRTSNDFVEALADKMVELVDVCGGRTDGLRSELVAAGAQILSEQAGLEYRRLIMRRFALAAVGRLEMM